MFEEDPFDRWCRTIIACCALVALLAELLMRQACYRIISQGKIAAIQCRFALGVMWRKLCWTCFAFYRRRICLPLMICGLMKAPSWADVEAYRIRLVAQSGHDIPRPAELEEGLQQEQQTSQLV